MDISELKMLDVRDPIGVEISINPDGRIWVNIDGICVLRISKGKHPYPLYINDSLTNKATSTIIGGK